MNRYRKNDKAVSPVIATILMVAITVVLAGVLVVYLQTLPQGAGSVETNIGIRAEKIANGTTNDSLISITTGSAKTTDMSVVVTNPTTGAQAVRKTMPSPFATQANTDVDFNDNNGNGKIDAGDTILVHGGAGVGFSDYKFSLVRGDNTLATRTLP